MMLIKGGDASMGQVLRAHATEWGFVCECTEPWICEIAQLRCAFISFAMLRVGLVAF